MTKKNDPKDPKKAAEEPRVPVTEHPVAGALKALTSDELVNAARMALHEVASDPRLPLLIRVQNLDTLIALGQNLKQTNSSGPGDPVVLPPDVRYQDNYMRCPKCGRVQESNEAQISGQEYFVCAYNCGYSILHDFTVEPHPPLPPDPSQQ